MFYLERELGNFHEPNFLSEEVFCGRRQVNGY